MKEKIHPIYYEKATVRCACGNTFTVGATLEKIEVDICSKCHPFFTGEEKLIDTAGRVEKFKARRTKAAAAPAKKKSRSRSNQDRGSSTLMSGKASVKKQAPKVVAKKK